MSASGPVPVPPPVVVKVGGSLCSSGRLGAVLNLVGRATRPIIVVPGGGRLAEAVRAEQRTLGFGDATAHRMALLAMHQIGELMCELEPRLLPCETLSGMRKALPAGRIPMWIPYALAARDPAIPQDWSITADGLAARLAERLGAPEVWLLKSCQIELDASPADLAGSGVADHAFFEIAARAGLRWRMFGPGDDVALTEALSPPYAGPRLGPAATHV